MNIDKSNMRDMIIDFPKQFFVGYESAGNVGKEFSKLKLKNIIIAGLGGSALPGELLNLFAEELNLMLPIYINRGYNLLSQATADSLVIAISYSGNTEETLSAYKYAEERKFNIAVITSNGEIEKLSKKNKTPISLIPQNIPPRIAIGYQFSALLGILANAKVIDSQEKNIKVITKTIDSLPIEVEAKKMAQKINNKIPLFYSSNNYKELAYILKIQINENAKRHAFCNSFPELNHNEMVGYENSPQTNFIVLILKADDDHTRIKKRMELTSEIIKKKGYDVFSIDIKGDNMYNKALNTILFGEWLSYHLAIQNEIDPTPVDIIENFKKEL